jgi:hypothetical protein
MQGDVDMIIDELQLVEQTERLKESEPQYANG